MLLLWAAVVSERILKWGICPAQSAGNFFVVPLHFFDSTNTISRFHERLRDGQYSFIVFLLAVLLLMVPTRAQSFVKVGTCPRAIWSRRHC